MSSETPTVGGLNIPDDARAAGFAAFARAIQGGYDGPQIYAQTLEAVAPLIVAAELEWIADALTVTLAKWRDGRREPVRLSALRYAITELRRRASELRGEGQS